MEALEKLKDTGLSDQDGRFLLEHTGLVDFPGSEGGIGPFEKFSQWPAFRDLEAEQHQPEGYFLFLGIWLSAYQGEPGKAVKVAGTGFNPRSNVTIWRDADADGILDFDEEILATAKASGFGHFAATFSAETPPFFFGKRRVGNNTANKINAVDERGYTLNPSLSWLSYSTDDIPTFEVTREPTPTPTPTPVLPPFSTATASRTPTNFKVAFIGDSDVNCNAVSVLRSIGDEGASMILHLGDLGYDTAPELWDRQVNSVLGADFPYFAVVGNHDCCPWPKQWADYQALLLERLEKVDGAKCAGDLGVKSVCTYKGLFFILSGAGSMG